MSVDGAKRFTLILTAIAIGAALWALLPVPARYRHRNSRNYAVDRLEAVRRSGGVIQIDRRKRTDKQPNVAVAVIMPGLMLMAVAAKDYNVVESATVVLLSVSAAALLSIVAFTADSTMRAQTRTVILLAGLSLSYGYGVTIEANVRFDRSDGESYQVPVEGKYTCAANRPRMTLISARGGRGRHRTHCG